MYGECGCINFDITLLVNLLKQGVFNDYIFKRRILLNKQSAAAASEFKYFL